ncbi:MAG: xanthine dehydrogenase family protein molybdopterin-binding subunit [Proteobacteria bacterium]|nr:xanthine dehydrogenase family protein molybdopterin-binding subunit [Pseudomonadota bacterium]
MGKPTPRIDGAAKVTGRALYPSDESVPHAAHAFLVTSPIARGRVAGFDLGDARAVPGFLDFLCHENVGGQAKPPKQMAGGETTTTMESDRIWHDGQIIGVVLADSFEAAREAAFKVRIQTEAEPPSATFGSAGTTEEQREDEQKEDFAVGDAEMALAAAPVMLDAWYETPTQHHNAIELFTTTCAWNGRQLTIWEPSQFVYGLRGNVAQQLGIEPADIRVVSKFVGGAFGSKGGATARTAWIAIAARRLGRPVKLVATRDQGFTIATYRAETRHHLRLGANGEGRLTAVSHEGWEVTSRPSFYNVSGTETTARMYAAPNILTRVAVVHADRNTPGFMRAPPEQPYMFPLECAMDELAARLGIDPIELRRRNEPARDPVTGLAFSGRHLMTCFDRGAAEFGWNRRNAQPASMRDGDWLVGLGCAASTYTANIAASTARVTLRPDGQAQVRLAGHDIGTGAYTVVAITAADRLGLPVGQVTVEMGDTEYPPAALAAGSSHTASITHAVVRACDALLAQIATAATASNAGAFAGREPATLSLRDGHLVAPDDSSESLADAVGRISAGAVEAYAENVPDGMPADAIGKLYQGQLPILRGQKRVDMTAYSFGAQFVEVRIHARTREIRVPRMLGAFSAGTILNPTTARSQLMGGMIWGLGSALLEKTEIDQRAARYTNDNIAEYHIAVNADVRRVDVMMLPEPDGAVNPLGIKGIGELGIVGVNAAVANAVFHATGQRVRRLPIRIEDLL